MKDCFDYLTYWEMLGRLTATHRAVRFVDLQDSFPEDPFFILRHDVDYSTAAALQLAEQESARGIHATYFLLQNGPYYNLLDPVHAHVPRRLTDLGHEVGLHYDARLLRSFTPDRWEHLMRVQIAVLETLSGATVTSIAMHQPALHGDDPLRNAAGVLNAYDDRFVRDMPYYSDSCRAWRDEAWSTLAAGGRLPQRFQLALHPINWSARDRDRMGIFRALHQELAASIETEGRDLLEKIRRHEGVLEHDARVRRSEMVSEKAQS
jgi:hypothetical protein